jgi:hypothetical protein
MLIREARANRIEMQESARRMPAPPGRCGFTRPNFDARRRI